MILIKPLPIGNKINPHTSTSLASHPFPAIPGMEGFFYNPEEQLNDPQDCGPFSLPGGTRSHAFTDVGNSIAVLDPMAFLLEESADGSRVGNDVGRQVDVNVSVGFRGVREVVPSVPLGLSLPTTSGLGRVSVSQFESPPPSIQPPLRYPSGSPMRVVRTLAPTSSTTTGTTPTTNGTGGV